MPHVSGGHLRGFADCGDVTERRAFLAERRGEPCGSGRRDVDSRGGWL